MVEDNIILFIFAWVFLAGLAAAWGNNRKTGAAITFLLSIVFSPVIGFIVAAASGEKPVVKTCPNCGWQGVLTPSMAGFCPACGKNKNGKTKEDFLKASSSL